jgi:hypothetical protein
VTFGPNVSVADGRPLFASVGKLPPPDVELLLHAVSARTATTTAAHARTAARGVVTHVLSITANSPRSVSASPYVMGRAPSGRALPTLSGRINSQAA